VDIAKLNGIKRGIREKF